MAKFHLAAVGLIASNWAGFELGLDKASLSLARIPETTGFCFTAQVIGPARKLDAYTALARLRGAKKFIGELDIFSQDTTKLAERRNRIVHDPWYVFVAQSSPCRLETTARRKLRHQFVQVTKDEILSIINDIDSHAKRFLALHLKIINAIGT
jgi:hypothetical protein